MLNQKGEVATVTIAVIGWFFFILGVGTTYVLHDADLHAKHEKECKQIHSSTVEKK